MKKKRKYFLSLKTKYKNSKSWDLLPTGDKSFGQGFCRLKAWKRLDYSVVILHPSLSTIKVCSFCDTHAPVLSLSAVYG